MTDLAIHITPAFRQHYDPTHTTALRKVFSKKIEVRFAELALFTKKAIVDQDCFGLVKPTLQTHQMNLPYFQQFDYPRSAEKLDAFMKWLQEQVNKGLLDVRVLEQVGASVESAWTNLYLYDSYKRGVMRARYELIKAGLTVSTIEASGGIDIVMGLPMHIDRLGLIFTRAYNELKGITDAMNSQISRVLAQGIADGDGPMLLAKKIVAVINGTGADKLGITDTLGRFIPATVRAKIMARTEIIRAHHLATIQEYRNWGLEGIKVMGEWNTAHDDRVCPKCEALDGKIFTLDEIEPMIPLHPQCRCIALPYIEDIQKFR